MPRKYSASCGIHDEQLGGETNGGTMSAPCGKIHVQSATEVPLLYTWIIQVWKDFEINTTVLELDVPFESLNCVHNYLRVYDNSSAQTKDIAKLCGRALGENILF